VLIKTDVLGGPHGGICGEASLRLAPALTEAQRSTVRGDLAVPRSRTTRYDQRCFAVSGPTVWTSLPLSVRDPSLTQTQFCARLKTVLFFRAYETLA